MEQAVLDARARYFDMIRKLEAALEGAGRDALL